ncbi:J domain-containing protein [Limnohabitans radicicola]|uniref:Molecular chaperone DnaJ n=1 Tax=Limnohabitans radicicola TaxID=2771427 RepID=A0A927FGX5_9BURK|nr:J domain-containing protein [Limnohabitans radicicola]MBD8050776.1 hypothetical protein [Limnohabitans radicicola]
MSTDNTPGSAAPSVYAALSVQARPDATLSPAQQRYNALLARIEALSAQVERLQAWSDAHRHAHMQALYQTAQQTRALRQSLLVFLHDKLQGDALTSQQQRMARTQVRGLIDQLGPDSDPQIQALAELYRLDEDELAEERAEEAQRLREQIEAALGQPIHNPHQYQTPEEMMAAGMRQWQRQQQADEERKAAKRAARKALKKPAAHQRAEVQQADARSAIRTIFRQLASALHPDREPDAQERERKTTLMSEVNAAYEKNDLSTLLRLQMQAALSDASGASRFADDQLAVMALLLKEQVSALEDDLAQMEFRLTRELCVTVSAQLSEAVMTQALQTLQANQRHEADSLSSDLRRIQSEAELKRWLKEQSRAFKATSA